MKQWLTKGLLDSAEYTPEYAEGFILGRGLPYQMMQEMHVGVWALPDSPCPDPLFAKRYGPLGQSVEDWVSVPIYSPRGEIIGVEFRRWDGEYGSQKFYLPESSWLPVFTGLVPSALHRIWSGGDVWLVEGLFDLALAHAVPAKDVVLACGGAKITPNQVAFLQRFMSDKAQVHIAFDMDDTGRKMAYGYVHPDTGKRVWGVSERLLRAGVRSRVVEYRGGKDPGEIWEKFGTSSLKSAFYL